MAHPRFLSFEQIVTTAVALLEKGEADGLSLRAVAALLGVKAPSLYRYFPNKEALEVAVADTILGLLLGEFQAASASADPDARLQPLVEAYLRFARKRSSLYTFVMQNRYPARYGSVAGKAVWNILLEVVSGVSGKRDDTAGAVALWAFLHGFATLERSGAFGASGPRGGLERGVDAFLSDFRRQADARLKASPAKASGAGRRAKRSSTVD